MAKQDILSFEIGPFRPPSEAFSLLIRATRNCPWNRCTFCNLYKSSKFEYRPVEEIKRDIDSARRIKDEITSAGPNGLHHALASVYQQPPNEAYRYVALWLYAGGSTAFLQDSNALIMRTPELVEVLKYLKAAFPAISRITSYGRSETADKKSLAELSEIHQAGLTRLHIGLETGYDPLLKYIDKGATAARHISAGKKVVASGIPLSEYVILGLGGKEMRRQHAIETARVLNEISPDFIRARTLTLVEGMPLYRAAQEGTFVRATDEEILEEERLLLENLNCPANFASDHIINLLGEIEGILPGDKAKMLGVIDRYFALSEEERTNYRVGRRAGIYDSLDDLSRPAKRQTVEKIVSRLAGTGGKVAEEIIYDMMKRFI
ncbi:MAG: radical SAM protein [Dehalococcoidia bacterium]|nr:MAG: radical SAM protein [Dehalococcoidia bacterium]